MIKKLSTSKWNSRKVFFGAALIAVAVLVELYAPKGFTATMAAFLGTIGATYFIGNVAEKKNEVGDQSAPKLPAPVDLSPIVSAINAAKLQGVRDAESIKDGLASVLESNTALAKQQQYIIERAFGSNQ